MTNFQSFSQTNPETTYDDDFYYYFHSVDQSLNIPPDPNTRDESLSSYYQSHKANEKESIQVKPLLRKKIKKCSYNKTMKKIRERSRGIETLIPFEEDFIRMIGKTIFKADPFEEFKSIQDIQKLFSRFSKLREQLVHYLREIYQTDHDLYLTFMLLVVKYSIYNFLNKLQILNQDGVCIRNDLRRSLGQPYFYEALEFVQQDMRNFCYKMNQDNNQQDYDIDYNLFDEQMEFEQQENYQHVAGFNNIPWKFIMDQIQEQLQIGKNYYKSHNCDYCCYILDNKKLEDPKTDFQWLDEKLGRKQSKANLKKFQIMLMTRLDQNDIKDFTLNEHFTYVLKEHKAQKFLYMDDTFNIIIKFGL
ncbi:hypothetical protein pb186bvf_020182 [Paramecium bursaria]